MVRSLTIDELTFELRWSRRRRTIGITIDRRGALVVAAPVGCRLRLIESAVRGKLPWVHKKLAEARGRPPQMTPTYADGERLPYLGAWYPLTTVEDDATGVKLWRGAFRMPDHIPEHRRRSAMVDWYVLRAHAWLPVRIASLAKNVDFLPTAVQIADLGQRWGTCDATGRVRLHWQVITLPTRIVDYIVVHELMHLRELNHSPRFWALVETVVPDYRERRAWLKAHGHRLSL
jgi:predicted metal-dependent hydrolase